MWNDPAIMDLQSQSVADELPAQPIALGVGTDDPISLVLSTALASYEEFAKVVTPSSNVAYPAPNITYIDTSGWWPLLDGVIAAWLRLSSSSSAPHLGHERVLLAGCTTKLSARKSQPNVLSIPMEFPSHTAPHTQGTMDLHTPNLFVLRLTSRIHPLMTDVQTINSAMNDGLSNLQPDLTGSLVMGKGIDSWPLTGWVYAGISMSDMTACTSANDLLNWIYWTMSNSQAKSLSIANDIVPAPSSVTSKVLDVLIQVTCNGAYVSKLRGCVNNGTVCSNQGIHPALPCLGQSNNS